MTPRHLQLRFVGRRPGLSEIKAKVIPDRDQVYLQDLIPLDIPF